MLWIGDKDNYIEGNAAGEIMIQGEIVTFNC